MLIGLDKFNADVTAWFASVESAAAEAAVSIAKDGFEQIIEGLPQYSSDMVSNVNVSVGAPDGSFTPGLGGNRLAGDPVGGKVSFVPSQRGDTQGMEIARARAKFPKITLGQSVFVSSNASHDEPYSVAVEEGLVNLRPVNQGADHTFRKTLVRLGNTYSHISKSQIATLRSKK